MADDDDGEFGNFSCSASPHRVRLLVFIFIDDITRSNKVTVHISGSNFVVSNIDSRIVLIISV